MKHLFVISKSKSKTKRLLKLLKYDGLFCSDIPCGCDRECLAPCIWDITECVPAMRKQCIGKQCEHKCEGSMDVGSDCFYPAPSHGLLYLYVRSRLHWLIVAIVAVIILLGHNGLYRPEIVTTSDYVVADVLTFAVFWLCGFTSYCYYIRNKIEEIIGEEEL